jgi:DUF4097 and DUF4098 domain-containing protein YvlB
MKSILNPLGSALAATLLFLGSTSVSGAGEVTEESTQSYPIEAGGKIRVANVNGSVRVVEWDKPEVEVHTTRRGSDEETMRSVKIEIEAKKDSLRIRTEEPKGKGHWFFNGGKASVDYVLHAPPTARLEKIESVNGSVDIHGFDQTINASTVNGRLDVAARGGDLKLSTVNGGITANTGAVAPSNNIEIETVNGGIKFSAPSNLSARVKIETVNGGVSSEFPLSTKSHFPVGKTVNDKIGAGEALVKMHTVNGGVKLLKNSETAAAAK